MGKYFDSLKDEPFLAEYLDEAFLTKYVKSFPGHGNRSKVIDAGVFWTVIDVNDWRIEEWKVSPVYRIIGPDKVCAVSGTEEIVIKPLYDRMETKKAIALLPELVEQLPLYNAKHELTTIAYRYATIKFDNDSTQMPAIELIKSEDGRRILLVENKFKTQMPEDYHAWQKNEIFREGKPEILFLRDALPMVARSLSLVFPELEAVQFVHGETLWLPYKVDGKNKLKNINGLLTVKHFSILNKAIQQLLFDVSKRWTEEGSRHLLELSMDESRKFDAELRCREKYKALYHSLGKIIGVNENENSDSSNVREESITKEREQQGDEKKEVHKDMDAQGMALLNEIAGQRWIHVVYNNPATPKPFGNDASAQNKAFNL
jgi:hypothetical protein